MYASRMMSSNSNLAIQTRQRVAEQNAQKLAHLKVSTSDSTDLKRILPVWGLTGGKDHYAKKASQHHVALGYLLRCFFISWA